MSFSGRFNANKTWQWSIQLSESLSIFEEIFIQSFKYKASVSLDDEKGLKPLNKHACNTKSSPIKLFKYYIYFNILIIKTNNSINYMLMLNYTLF